MRVPKVTSHVQILSLLALGACTGQVDGTFRYAQEEQNFSTNSQVNTKLDILWVIDNSGSMEPVQKKVRDGLTSFANKYMLPTWDIRSAVITSDTYLANGAFTNFLNTAITANGGSVGFESNYLNGIGQTLGGQSIPGRDNFPFSSSGVVGTAAGPSWAPSLFTLQGNGKWQMVSGVSMDEIKPQYGPNWAKLLDSEPGIGSGNHDGPQLGLCWERDDPSPQYLYSLSSHQCWMRDSAYFDGGTPNPYYHTGIANCVTPNTGNGETSVTQCVNTPSNNSVHSGKSIITTLGGVQSDLANDFIVNVSVGAIGSGVEGAMMSVEELLKKNEEAVSSTNKLFRADSLRLIIFVTDEQDQSFTLPGTEGAIQYVPSASHWTNGALPDQYTPQMMKDRLDTFFTALDGSGVSGNPNYFVGVISGDLTTNHNDIVFANLVGNGSVKLDLTSSNYDPLLDSIGQVIVSKKAVFQLTREPVDELTLVKIKHVDGTSTVVDPTKFSIVGKVLTITDEATVLGLKSTDQVVINYQPNSLN